MGKRFDIFIDGACRGNPGIAAIGVLIKQNGKVIRTISQSIGQATNNIAEYTALVYALQDALILKADQIVIRTDSELLYNQIEGIYKVKNQKLKSLYTQARHLLKGFNSFQFIQIPREQNKEADKLAGQAIKKAGQDGRPDAYIGEESPSSKG